jgi:hypothetical protein
MPDDPDGVYPWAGYRKHADAVLAAMRKPTEAMVKAGDLPGWDDDITIGHGTEIWQAMIDAALTEGAPE